MKKILTLLVLAAIGGAYVAGYWPEHEHRAAIQTQIEASAARLASAEAQLRLCQLEGRLLALIETVEDKNYGSAQTLASAFFDAVRAESARQPAAGTAALTVVLAERDRVTAGLAQADPDTEQLLRTALDALRGSLGQPRRPTPPAPSDPS